MDPERVPAGVDPTTPSVARVYDFYLGGSHNFESDREFGRRALAAMPDLPARALDNRAFLRRVVQHLCERGIDQFLDLGSGIPTVGNVHEVAHELVPGATVVYVDHDSVAVTHGTALLQDDPRATSVLADVREPEAVLAAATATGLLDLGRPVAVLAMAVLHFVPDDDRPADLMARYMAAAAAGSFLAISHGRFEGQGRARDLVRVYDDDDASPSRRMCTRTTAEVEALFGSVVLEDPGVVALPCWHPEPLDGGANDGPTVEDGYPAVGGLGRRS